MPDSPVIIVFHPLKANHNYFSSFFSCLKEYFRVISNHFPGGIFQSVRQVSLDDEKAFDHHISVSVSPIDSHGWNIDLLLTTNDTNPLKGAVILQLFVFI